jgi:FixJ family two-component response regulator
MTDVTIHVIDDDQSIRETTLWLLNSAGYQTIGYPSATAFLDRFDPAQPGCVLVDLKLPVMDGLELQSHIEKQQWRIPLIFMSACADVEHAVYAMRCGALDFLKKPIRRDVLLQRVTEAIEKDHAGRERQLRLAVAFKRFDRLTPREEQVLHHVVNGELSKQIAIELRISPRTVEVHRSRIMEKTACDSVAELVRLVIESDLSPLSTEGDRA